MFESDSHLPQLLPPSAYASPEGFQTERETIFADAWHGIGSIAEFPKVGSYRTVRIDDRNIILWRTEAGVRAYLNVCPHRFSELTSQPCGTVDRLKCQYHGWEYDGDGRTRRIPEAQGFKPLVKDQFALTGYRIEQCGQLLFLTTSNTAPPLREFLGEHYDLIEELFPTEHPLVFARRFDVPANWKAIIENALESYHLESVHTRTFKTNPPADQCKHRFEADSSLFYTDEPPVGRLQRLADWLVYRLIGIEQDRVYRHHLRYPHTMLGEAGLFRWIEVPIPIAVDHTEVLLLMVSQQMTRRNPLSRVVYETFRFFARRFSILAFEEDASLMPSVQRGLSSTEHPSEGIISTREERVHHFQKQIAEHTGLGGRDGKTLKRAS